MRVYVLCVPLLCLALASCAGGRAPSAGQRAAADDLNQSGRPYAGPAPLRSSFPPGDSSFTPLYCHPEGPGTVCARAN